MILVTSDFRSRDSDGGLVGTGVLRVTRAGRPSADESVFRGEACAEPQRRSSLGTVRSVRPSRKSSCAEW